MVFLMIPLHKILIKGEGIRMLLGCFPATIQRVLVITPKRYSELVDAGVLIELGGRCDFCSSVQRYICYLNAMINNKKIMDVDNITACYLDDNLSDNDILSMTKIVEDDQHENLDLDLPEGLMSYV